MMSHRFAKLMIGALLAAAVAVPAPAFAQQRPAAYEAARKAGQVGEKMDGYLAAVGSQPQSIQDLVADINIKRRANYAAKAQQANPPATLEQYAVTQGCVLISLTQPGEKYQAPDGSWQTRGAGPPQLHSRCPQ